jgi:hypothetical protein
MIEADASHTPEKSRLHWVWLIFLILIVGYAVVMALMPWNEKISRARIQAMHVATPQWGSWAPWQLLPAMYNFSNFGEIRGQNELNEPVLEISRYNHYPAQFLTFTHRTPFVRQAGTRYLSLETHYRGRAYRTDYSVWTLDRAKEAFKTMTVVKTKNAFQEIANPTIIGQFQTPVPEVTHE